MSVTLIVIGDTCALGQRGVDPGLIAFAVSNRRAILPISGLRLAELSSLLHWRIILRGAMALFDPAALNGTQADVFGAFFGPRRLKAIVL